MHGNVPTFDTDPQAEGPSIKHAWSALVVLVAALGITSLDHTIINVALPSIARDTGATESQLQWLVDAYTIVFAALLMVAGNLGDRRGRKRALVAGLALFGLGATIAAGVGSVPGLIAGRAVMGVGGALIMPATLSLLVNTFTTPHERSIAISAWSAVAGLGVAVGPVVGGWLVETWSWSAAFWINIPLVVITGVSAMHALGESKDATAAPADVVGAILSVATISAIVWTIIEAPKNGWSDPLTLAGAALGILLIAAFVAWEHHVSHPMLQIDVLRDRRFAAASAGLTITFLGLAGSIFVIAQFLQFVLGYSALRAGVALLPAAAGLLAGTHAAAHLDRHHGTRLTVTAGIGIAGAGLATQAIWATATTYQATGIGLLLLGIGLGLAMPSATTSIMDALPKSRAGTGSAVNDTVREIGSALGVAILGSALASRYASAVTTSMNTAGVTGALSESVRHSITSALATAHDLGPAGGRIALDARAAFVSGMRISLWLAVVATAVAATVAARYLPRRTTEDIGPLDRVAPDDPSARALHIDAARVADLNSTPESARAADS
jgi:EmrB/QacA subfamily drug resistance transporter